MMRRERMNQPTPDSPLVAIVVAIQTIALRAVRESLTEVSAESMI
jgi:hypothetical protein